MKLTKKTSALILAFILAIGMGSASALAAEEPCLVTVTEGTIDNVEATLGTTSSSTRPPDARSTINLGTSDSINYSWTLSAGGTLYSSDYFKTESEKIAVRMLASPSTTSITVSLYSSSGGLVGSQTVSVGTAIQSKVTFTNLSSANLYYIKMTNNDQHTATISGTFAAK